MRALSLRVVYKFCPHCKEPLGYVANPDDEDRVGIAYGDEGFGDGNIRDMASIESICGKTVKL